MAEALPLANIVHSLPGRTRLRIPKRRGDRALFASIVERLSVEPGVARIEVEPLTGSILAYHGASLTALGAAAEDAGLFRLATESGAAAPQRKNLSRHSEARSRPRLQAEPRLVLASGLLAIALWQVMRGHFLPPALTLAWYAARIGGLWELDVAGDDGLDVVD
jgi:hypothetical protein